MKYFNRSVVIAFLMSVNLPPIHAQQPTLEQMQQMLPRLDQMIQTNPKDAKALASRGYIHLQNGDLQKSLVDFNAAEAADPQMKEIYFSEVVLYLRLKDYPNALTKATKAIQLTKSAEAYNNRAGVYSAMGKPELGAPDLNAALKLKPGSADAYSGFSEIAYKAGQYDRCVAYASKALSLDPRAAEALFFRGNAYAHLKRPDLAKRDLDAAAADGYREGEPFVRTLGQ